MTAPRAATDTGLPPSVPFRIGRLRKRSDFLRAARARRHTTKGFVLQARRREASETADTPIRVGFTCSRKVGNAVARNRARRRLRAVVRDIVPVHGRPGWDYVLIGRHETTATRTFALMAADLAEALEKVHG